MHDREQIYTRLWNDYSDRLGILTSTQLEIAAELEVPYQRLSLIFSEYQKAGYMKKYRHKFQLKNPDRIDWEEFSRVRKTA